jgi:DNA polymerase-3 subunit gamma/tau
MRDAQSLLDQLLAFGGQRLTVEHVHRLLGTASDDRVAALATAALAHDPKRALELLAEAADEGLQLGELVDQLLAYWRDLMVAQAAGPQAPALAVSIKHRPALLEQARALSLDTILAGLDILCTTKARLRTTSHGRVFLEMAVVRLGRLEQLESLTQLAQALANRQTLDSRKPLGSDSAPEPPKKKPSLTAESVAALEDNDVAVTSRTVELNDQSLPTIWSQVLAQLGQFQRADLEKASFLAISGPNTLVLRFEPGYNAAGIRARDPDKVAKIEQLLLQITGQPYRIRIESETTTDAASSVRIAGDPEYSQSQSSALREGTEQPPLVKWAEDLLGAKIVKRDPGFGASASASVARADAEEIEEL